MPATHKIVGSGSEVVLEAPEKCGKPTKIQEEVVKVPKQCARSGKVAEAEISQFKECLLPKNGER